MKKYQRNNIKRITQSKSVRTALLLFFIFHYFLVHVFFQSYVFCFEADGRVVLESMTGTYSCCNTNLVIASDTDYLKANTNEDCNLCEDVALAENCDDEYSVTKKKFQTIEYPLVSFITNFNVINNKNSSALFIQNHHIPPYLNSNKTVILLI